MRNDGCRFGNFALAGEQLHARCIAELERAQNDGKCQGALGKQRVRRCPLALVPEVAELHRKIRDVLLGANCDALARLQAGAVKPGQKAVVVLLACVEI